ncbi:MAG: 50S ribosomal protein L6 [Deltaproteobacteria bacterium]|nr:50S ribosomal protein L6 [Deltaproteobacteria bacterium]
MTETHTGKQSRNGKKPVEVAKGVQISISGRDITAKGPKGELTYALRPEVVVTQGDGTLTVRPAEGAGKAGLQYQGLTRALLRNMVEGVANGYKRSLDFRGVGYRAEFKNHQLKMTVGLSHQPILDIPKVVGIKVETIDEAGTKFPRVHLESPDKEIIGRVAARIRQMRPPEPYNGKGVRYTGERIREKAGKAGKAGG